MLLYLLGWSDPDEDSTTRCRTTRSRRRPLHEHRGNKVSQLVSQMISLSLVFESLFYRVWLHVCLSTQIPPASQGIFPLYYVQCFRGKTSLTYGTAFLNGPLSSLGFSMPGSFDQVQGPSPPETSYLAARGTVCPRSSAESSTRRLWFLSHGGDHAVIHAFRSLQGLHAKADLAAPIEGSSGLSS